MWAPLLDFFGRADDSSSNRPEASHAQLLRAANAGLERDFGVIKADVSRTGWESKAGVQPEEEDIFHAQLQATILEFLDENRAAVYLQALVYIAAVALLALKDNAIGLLNQLYTGGYIRPFLSEPQPAPALLSHFVLSLVATENTKLAEKLAGIELFGMLIYGWLTTGFTHIMSDLGDAIAYLHFMLTQPAYVGLYACAAVILHNADNIFGLNVELNDLNLHVYDFYVEMTPIDVLVAKTEALLRAHTIESVPMIDIDALRAAHDVSNQTP